jgi:hypothetical protein
MAEAGRRGDDPLWVAAGADWNSIQTRVRGMTSKVIDGRNASAFCSQESNSESL